MASEMYEPAIFTSEQVTYGDFYAWFKAKLVAAGWENITSNYTTDGDVWHSTGVGGTNSLYFRTFAPRFSTSYGGMQTTPYLKYTPAAPGSAGTFIGDGTGGRNFAPPSAPNIGSEDTTPPTMTTFTVHSYFNKDRAIVFLTLPEALYNTTNYSGYYGRSVLWYIGAPELYSTSASETEYSKGVIIWGHSYNTSGLPSLSYYTGMSIYSSVGDSPTMISPSNNLTYSLDTNTTFRIKNTDGRRMLLDIVCGGSYEGMLLRIKDIFFLPESTNGSITDVFEGDLVSDGEYTFKIFLIQMPGYRMNSTDKTNKYAIRVS